MHFNRRKPTETLKQWLTGEPTPPAKSGDMLVREAEITVAELWAERPIPCIHLQRAIDAYKDSKEEQVRLRYLQLVIARTVMATNKTTSA